MFKFYSKSANSDNSNLVDSDRKRTPLLYVRNKNSTCCPQAPVRSGFDYGDWPEQNLNQPECIHLTESDFMA